MHIPTVPIREALTSIRGRLLAGFGGMILLLVLAGVTARTSLTSVGDQIGISLATTRREAQATARLASSVSQGLSASSRYLATRDSATRRAFEAHLATAHAAQKDLTATEGMTSNDITLLIAIERRLSLVGTLLNEAHRLAERKDTPAALARADSAQRMETDLLADIQTFGQSRAIKMEATSRALREHADERANLLIGVILAAILLGAAIVASTMRSIGRPLEHLVDHARALSEGRLGVRTSEAMPGEFQDLAGAMNTTAEALSRLATVARQTAGDVSESAHQLSSAAEQISVAAGQTVSAMSYVTDGAEKQVAALQDVDESLARMRVDRKSTRLNSSHIPLSRMPSSA